MADIEKKTIEERIDKNKDNIRDYMEIRDFLLEDKNQTKNIKDLGSYLNNIGDSGYNEIKQTLQSVIEGPEIIKMFEGIEEKVKKNETLTDDEISVLYINAVLYGKGNGFINVGEFDLSLPIEKICNGYLLAYIQKRYNNYNYNPNKEKGDRKPTVENTKKEEEGYRNPNVPNPFPEEIDEEEKVENEYNGLPVIPLIRGNEYVHAHFNKIIKWAEANGYLMEAERESKERNEFRTHVEYDETGEGKVVYDKEYKSYVEYDKLLIIFGKYCEVINKKHEELVKKAGYWDLDEFAEEMKYIDGIQEYLKSKYPDLDETMERVKPYFKEMEENKKKYFGGKTEEEVEKAGKEFGEYKKYEQEKIEEYGITEETIKSLCEIPKDEKELEAYLKNLNAYILYQNETEGKKREYGENIDKYLGYIKGIQAIRAKYGEKELESDLEMIKNYMDDLESSGKMYKPKGQEVGQVPGALTIFDKFNKYSELMGANPELSKDLKNMKTINEVLSDPTGDDFWITDVKNDKQKEKKKQEERDKRRNNWYEKYPVRYELLSTGASIWNTFINFTVGTGTSLGAMICGMILGKEHYQSSLQRKERWDSSLTIGVTREQQEGIYDSETGKITLNWKNGPYMVASSVTNMYLLILGGDAAGKGVSKIFSNMGMEAVGKAGLFSMSFITQAGQSYTEAMNAGLEGNGAFIYSMLTATAQSSLELVSPNEVLLGKGTGVGKEMVRALCKGGNKGGIKLAGKYYLKTMFREMGEEILQEEMQLAAGNLINDFYNGTWNTNFESDWGYKNFLATAMITAMTTGVATGISSGGTTMQIMRGKRGSLINKIFTTEGLYEDVMKVLENAIKGEQKIPDVKVEQLEELKKTLELINTIQEQNNENPNTVQENQENENIKQDNDGNKENSAQTEVKESQDNETAENSKNKKKRNKDYFDGQPHEFDVTQEQAIENSQYMDIVLENVINETDEGKLQELLNDIKNHIEEQYEKTTGQNLNLSEDQIWSILDAHSEDGALGELTRAQLRKKVRPLTETIADEKVRRFLLEFGFCGKTIENKTYEIGDTIKIIKNDGTIINAKILEFEYVTNIKYYKIEWHENGENKYYYYSQQELNDIEYNGNNDGKEDQNTDVKKGNKNNIDYIKNLGIDVIRKNIFEIEELTNEQLENIKNVTELCKELGIKVYSREIQKIKNLKFTPEQRNNIIKIRKLEIKFDAGNLEDIINVKDDEIENITNLKNLGINIDIENISDAKKIELKPEEINNISKIISYGIIVNILDIEKIKGLTPEENNNIKVIKIDLKINVDAQSIENIKKIKLTENEINNIKKIKDLGIDITVEDINTIKDFNEDYTDLNYENNDSSYEYNKSELEANRNYKCGTVIEEIEIYVQNCISENRDIGIKEILQSVRPNLISLTLNEKINIIRGTIKVVTKFNTVRKYIDFENGPYKNKYPNAKALLCAMNGCYYPEKITDDITVKQHGSGLMFYIGDMESYRILAGEGFDKGSGGLHFHDSEIKELGGAYSIVNGKDPGSNTEKTEYGTTRHEGQHNWNDYFMVDKGINQSLVYAKDEITAFLRDGRDCVTIEKILTKTDSEGGLYNYGLQGEERENHKAQVKKLLIYANNLIELTKNPKSGITRERVISMLSNASVNQREDLNILITESVQQHIDRSITKIKIEGLKERFITKIKERAGNNKLINNLIEFWNSIFPNYGIEIEELRWAGTAKKETVIDNIEKCNTIEEIKHVLNDPKYSHIGWGPNNLGGIEVSQIIDEVIAGKQLINNIPTELRETIQEIYNKQMTSENGTQNQTNEIENQVNKEETQQSTEQQEVPNEGKTNVERLQELGIEIGAGKDKINNLTLDFEKLHKIKDLGINIGYSNIQELNNLEMEQIELIEKLKNIGIEIICKDMYDNYSLDKRFFGLGLTDTDIQFIKDNHLTKYSEINFALSIKDNANTKTIQEYSQRKQKYLETHRTISEEKFIELFGKKGKYGKTEVNQRCVGICYAYSGFEMLKKSNYFNELIQTNLRESKNGDGWEVRMPMGDENGSRIKVNKNEIDMKLKTTDENTGEQFEWSINSESDYLGFKILEIAFMKGYILNMNTKQIKNNEHVQNARKEFANKGDFIITLELLELVEGGKINEFYQIAINNKYILTATNFKSKELDAGVSEEGKELAFNNFNTGSININIGVRPSEEYFKPENLTKQCEIIGEGENLEIIVNDVKIVDKAGYNFEAGFEQTENGLKDKKSNGKGEIIGNDKMVGDLVINKNGKTVVKFEQRHAYSIEKCYIDNNTGEKRVRVINPRHTGLKFDISLEEAKSIFAWNVTGFDIDAMFR